MVRKIVWQTYSTPREPTLILTIHGFKVKYYEAEKILTLNYTREEMMNIFQNNHSLPVFMRVFTMGSSMEETQEILEKLFTPDQFEKNLIALRLTGDK